MLTGSVAAWFSGGCGWRLLGGSRHMRFCKMVGVLLGSLHCVLYFAVPVYGSYLEKIAPPVLCLPVMFFFGFWWPILMFFAFAPSRFYPEPGTQKLILRLGAAFRVPVGRLALRVVALVLLWPFSIMNFHVLYYGLQE